MGYNHVRELFSRHLDREAQVKNSNKRKYSFESASVTIYIKLKFILITKRSGFQVLLTFNSLDLSTSYVTILDLIFLNYKVKRGDWHCVKIKYARNSSYLVDTISSESFTD